MNEIKEKLDNLHSKILRSSFAKNVTESEIIALIESKKAVEKLAKYEAIGTVKQLEWCKDASHWKELFKEKLEQYEAIGTVEEFKALKEKSVAKKPRFYAHNYLCGVCGYLVGNDEFEWKRFGYCQHCGNKIDWQ